MRGRVCLLVGVVVAVPAAPASGQLTDSQFKPPTRPELTAPPSGNLLDAPFFKPGAKLEPFTEKTMFPPPKKPSEKESPLWCGGVEFGLTGSDGNSDVLNIRFGARAKRESDTNLFTTDLLYGYTRQAGQVTADKALWNVRDEVPFLGTPWATFLAGQLEYDQFRAYDFRVATHAGFALQAVKTDHVSLRTRLGAGCSREIGTPDARYVPEGLLGGDLDVKITDRQRFLTTLDYYPDLGRPGQYRVRARAAYEILVEPDWGMTIRLGVQERYDSNPGPAKRNDVDYFGTLMFKF
jgi:hypothetical protein